MTVTAKREYSNYAVISTDQEQQVNKKRFKIT